MRDRYLHMQLVPVPCYILLERNMADNTVVSSSVGKYLWGEWECEVECVRIDICSYKGTVPFFSSNGNIAQSNDLTWQSA